MRIAQLRLTVAFAGLSFCISVSPVMGATFNAADPAEFQTALTTAAANGEDEIVNVAAGGYAPASPLEYASVENHAFVIDGADDDMGARPCFQSLRPERQDSASLLILL